MVHTITFRVTSERALDFWEQRLAADGATGMSRLDGRLRFDDPEGLGLELAAIETSDTPLVAEHPEIPPEVALQGFDGVRAYSAEPERSRETLESTRGFVPEGVNGWESRGDNRGGLYGYDPPPAESPLRGAGTVHHVAWSSRDEEHEEWWRRVSAAGLRPSPIIDRFWFRSIYFREPSGVLFELATLGPGFAADEAVEHLGERLTLPPAFEHLRDQVEPILTPIPDPRPWAKTT
jgi:glyoxalase family protein